MGRGDVLPDWAGGGGSEEGGRGDERECVWSAVFIWRASEFEMGVLGQNRINRNFLIDAVPGMSPYIRFGSHLSRTC